MLAALLCINPFVVVAVVCLCAIFVYRYMRETYSVFEKLGIPSPKPVWVFGNTLEMKDKNPLTVFQEWRKVYGDVYGFYEGFRGGVVVHGHEMAHEILTKNFECFHGRPSYRPFKYYPDDMQIINIKGDQWKSQRAALNKTLNFSGTINQLFATIGNISDSLLEKLDMERSQNPNGFDIAPILQKFTSNAMSRFLLGIEDEDMSCHGDALFEFGLESNKAASPENEYVGLGMLFPGLVPLLKYFNKKHETSHEQAMDILKQYVTKTVAGQNNNDVKQNDHPSLLSQLMSTTILSRDIDGSLTRRELTNEELLSHMMTLLAETFTTSSAQSSFLMYELARNPDVQEKLYEEICQVCGKDGKPELSSIHSMAYFDKVFSETYRLHPIAPGLTRECEADCTIKGTRFQKGMVVRIMTCTLYNDEQLFPNPTVFDPERFSPENKEGRPTSSFLPFGAGPRQCPGQKFASLVVKMPIILILSRYRLEITEQTEYPLQHAFRPVVTAKNGVHIRLTPRC